MAETWQEIGNKFLAGGVPMNELLQKKQIPLTLNQTKC